MLTGLIESSTANSQGSLAASTRLVSSRLPNRRNANAPAAALGAAVPLPTSSPSQSHPQQLKPFQNQLFWTETPPGMVHNPGGRMASMQAAIGLLPFRVCHPRSSLNWRIYSFFGIYRFSMTNDIINNGSGNDPIRNDGDRTYTYTSRIPAFMIK
ncbi:hypothetical protein BDN72DRAFT_840718 [Pluteus cervinus]|uniref:Uncharacterized protein n=1 Tax=Pluteus cervinus TaxID=181527 RepID=A0ACD3ATW0_9AGAR|nr:hypothetical protein BDN72DRAFT_840718 [Pluteus cervinus]